MVPMSKHGHGHRHHGRGGDRARSEPRDAAVWIAIVMGGVFAMVLWYLVSSETWRHGLVGYLIAVAVLVNYYAWRVSAGRSLRGWQRAMARLPLRWVGYGTRNGKPLDAAKGSPRARLMILVSIAASTVLIVLATWVLVPL